MKSMPAIILLLLVIACASSPRSSAPPVRPTPNLPASRQAYCEIFQDQFHQKYGLSFSLAGPNLDVMMVKHRDKSMLLVADAMMFNNPDFMPQLNERAFTSVQFTNGKGYTHIVPVK